MLRETFTENGRVRGVVGTDARITVYKGIPFADATSGKNRWRPPQPGKACGTAANSVPFPFSASPDGIRKPSIPKSGTWTRKFP